GPLLGVRVLVLGVCVRPALSGGWPAAGRSGSGSGGVCSTGSERRLARGWARPPELWPRRRPAGRLRMPTRRPLQIYNRQSMAQRAAALPAARPAWVEAVNRGDVAPIVEEAARPLTRDALLAEAL